MNRTELTEILAQGENSGVEFKRDDAHPDNLAKEIAALANLEGGYVVLGVEDDGTVSGLTREMKEAEEGVINICSHNLQPSLIPYIEFISWPDEKKVAVITIPADSPDKPYKARRGGYWVTYVRVGSRSREASREEEQRLYQAAGVMRYDIKPVPGSSLKDFDLRRLSNYFADIRSQECPPLDDEAGWQQLLITLEGRTLENGNFEF